MSCTHLNPCLKCLDKVNPTDCCDCLGTTEATELKNCGVKKCDTGCETYVPSSCVVVEAPTFEFNLTLELIAMNEAIKKLRAELEIVKATCCDSCTMVMGPITIIS